MKKPNLFIAGAPKSGTTFLYHNLKKHPDFFLPKIKELNFFSFDLLDQVDMYYKDYQVKDKQKYLNHFRKVTNEKYLVDSSVSYFSFEGIPKRIKTFNPSAKVVFILRNPVNRAYSHYRMDVRMGYADKEFEEYIKNKVNYPAHFIQYIGNSLYFENIKNYLKEFAKEDLSILILEEIDDDLPRLMTFLNIDFNSFKVDTSVKMNEIKKPKNAVSRLLQKNRNLTSRLKLIVPESLIKNAKKHLYENAEKRPINETDKNILETLLVQDVKNLSQLLERDLNRLWDIY